MSLNSLLEDPSNQLKNQLSPIEQDPRYLELLKEYKCTMTYQSDQYRQGSEIEKCLHGSIDRHAIVRNLLASKSHRLVTAPLYTVSMSMQLSVMPHLTIYGDVKESDLKKGVIRQGLEGIGLLDNKSRASQTKELSAEVRHDLMNPPEVRADLMKASG